MPEQTSEQTVCSFCGKELDFWDQQSDLVMSARPGYGSVYDGETIHIRFCCDCFDKLVDSANRIN